MLPRHHTEETRTDVLQCTAVTQLPPGETLVALLGMRDGPDDADDYLADKGIVLCELGDHTDDIEHAARLWSAESEPPLDLWFRWTMGSGAHRIYHRFATVPACPAILRTMEDDSRQWCGFFAEHHPLPHSFDVVDPLRDAIAEQARRDARRLVSEDGPDEAPDK
ncbi:hypothetical protein ACFCWB_33270 [Streptomyces bacillaris]|uniref:hypothetical protein n=1 Tax=Streptomyces bacillaris TaxID=68179 RepID=UPI0035E1379F